jgi:hypothetical protein
MAVIYKGQEASGRVVTVERSGQSVFIESFVLEQGSDSTGYSFIEVPVSEVMDFISALEKAAACEGGSGHVKG